MRYEHVRLDCGHDYIFTPADFKNVRGHTINENTLIAEDLYYCDKCAGAEPGFCRDTALHKMISRKPMSPLEVMQSGVMERVKH